MRFRPCIDIHNGKVKQIVGGSLSDQGDQASENFVAQQDAAFFARLYRKRGLTGGHVILLNPEGSEHYTATHAQAFAALEAFPGGLQIGGGVRADNAAEYLDRGASHVIVTSYVFREGRISYENLEKIKKEVGRERLALDLSCRKKDGDYYVVTDRWQKFTDTKVTVELFQELGESCGEFLVHAVDVEGKSAGIDEGLTGLLAQFTDRPVTYAGGVGGYEDLERLRRLGKGRLDVTVGSALDLFGGPLAFDRVLELCDGEKDLI